MDSQTQMKQAVADAAIREVKSDMILGLGSGSTAALMIKSLADEMRSGKLQNIRGVATSFQSEVLALELDIPLIDLASVSQIDLAIDGADEVDPGFQLIKGGGACHVREKLVASKANQLLIVVDETKLVQNLNQSFPLPVEVLPNAWKQVQEVISEMNGSSSLRMAIKKAGPVVTDQGNLILDVLFNDGIKNPKDIEMKINNITGVLENGLFVDLTDKVLVGKIENNTPVVYSPTRTSYSSNLICTELAWLCKPSLLARLIISRLLTFKLSSLNSIIEVFFIKVSTPKEPLNLEFPDVGKV